MVTVELLLAMIALAGLQTNADNSDWRPNPATPLCALNQRTASGDLIELKRTPGNDATRIELTLHSNGNVRSGRFRQGEVLFGSAPGIAADISEFVDGNKVRRVLLIIDDQTFLSKLRGASGFTFAHGGGTPQTIPLRSTAAVVDTLRGCEDAMMRGWGMDVSAWRGLARRPTPSRPIDDLFTDLDYPGPALAQGLEADAITRLDVGADGRVKDCQSLNSGTYKGFEKAACDVLRGAKFKPALGADGQPVSAPYVYDVVFRIER